MTYATQLQRLVVAGNLYGGPERWSWSLNFGPEEGDGTGGGWFAVPPALITAVQTFHTRTGMIAAGATLDKIKWNRIGTDGKYASPITVEHDFNPPGVAGAGAVFVAPQIALAVTLRTSIARGLGSRGRFFLPVPAYQPASASEPRITAANAIACAANVTSLLNDIHTAIPGWRCVIASEGGLYGQPVNREVSRVEVGRVLDTIRSRRTSLDEDHQQGALLAG